ncbi:hypothetical protein [Hyphomonas sp.]|uniref:hypothetical protein n=1 Tax=Hyphomonas sp. TaxID=87 RepID=UPI0025BB735C|nr:hypothetical protein [Hyphomonas sp.]
MSPSFPVSAPLSDERNFNSAVPTTGNDPAPPRFSAHDRRAWRRRRRLRDLRKALVRAE